MGLDYEIFKLGNVRLQRGGTLPTANLLIRRLAR